MMKVAKEEKVEMAVGSLLYHAVHGLFRVDSIIKQEQSGGEVVRCYTLVPNKADRAKTRFTVAVHCVAETGFHQVVSVQEANKILQYLKDGVVTAVPARVVTTIDPALSQSQTWDLAQMILTSAFEKFEARDQRKRQMLARSAKGLIGELAIVFDITLQETAAKIRKSLGNALSINPLVLTALANASED